MLTPNNSHGAQLSIQAVEQIYARHLGTSKSHVTRHTTAHTLDELGVPLSEIQDMLDHNNAATTGLYTRVLKRDQNKHGHALEQVFGISARPPEDVGRVSHQWSSTHLD
jgi:site-specific recombinase XerD